VPNHLEALDAQLFATKLCFSDVTYLRVSLGPHEMHLFSPTSFPVTRMQPPTAPVTVVTDHPCHSARLARVPCNFARTPFVGHHVRLLTPLQRRGQERCQSTNQGSSSHRHGGSARVSSASLEWHASIQLTDTHAGANRGSGDFTVFSKSWERCHVQLHQSFTIPNTSSCMCPPCTREIFIVHCGSSPP
jgi:hypothetical protein